MEEDLTWLDDFEESQKLSTVDSSNFDEADTLELQIEEKEARKNINAIEARRSEIGDDDADLLIDKAKHKLKVKERDLVVKNKPVPTDAKAPEKTMGENVDEFVGDIGDVISDTASAIAEPFKPAAELGLNLYKKANNALGGTLENAWNMIGGDIDLYDQLRTATKEEGEQLNKEIDPEGKLLVSPTESMSILASLIPIGKTKEFFAGIEGALAYTEEFQETGEIFESVNEAAKSASIALVGGRIAEKFFGGGKVPSDFAEDIKKLGVDDRNALNNVLDTLDANDIKMLDVNGRNKLMSNILEGKMDTNELALNVGAMLQKQKTVADDVVQASYKEADKIGNKTEPTSTAQVLLDTIGKSKGTTHEKKALKEIKILLGKEKGSKLQKQLNAADMESALSDLKGLQRLAKGKGKYIYGEAIKDLQKMQDKLVDPSLYKESRKLSADFHRNYTGMIDGVGAEAGAKVGKVLDNKSRYNIGRKLLGKDIDPENISVAVEGLSSTNKMNIVQDLLSRGVQDAYSPKGVKQLVSNWNKITDKTGMEVLIGKDAVAKMGKEIDALATIESAILTANKADTQITREILDIATAASMVSLSPFLAARSTGHGIKAIAIKKGWIEHKSILTSRIRQIKDAPLREKLTKVVSALSAQNSDAPLLENTIKTADKAIDYVSEGIDNFRNKNQSKEEVKEIPKDEMFSKEFLDEFEANYTESEDVKTEKTVNEPVKTKAEENKIKWGNRVLERSKMNDSLREDVRTGRSNSVNKDRVYNKLVSREAKKTRSYIDSRGFLTAGIGHKLSEAEKRKYPKGSNIPESQINKWYSEDTKKSKNAAKMQAKDIGEPKLEEALIHVNFQLGTSWKKKFYTTYPLLKEKKYSQAISNLKSSAWMKQTPKRVNDFIEEIRKVM